MAKLRAREKPGSPDRTIAEVFSVASPLAVERAARRLRLRLRNERWLGLNNTYRLQAPKRIRKEYGRRRLTPLIHKAKSIPALHLGEYIAASAILHCSDGWAYLGRAIAAQLRGDINASRHFAYYAELRASISLLAAQGVGVFSGIHVLLEESDDVELFKQLPTHEFAWEALSKWTHIPASSKLFGEVIRPSDASLRDWLDPLSGGPLWEATGRNYLRSWGLDVQRLGHDRAARNESSYQPRTFYGATVPPSARAAAFSQDFWRLFEPDGGTNFGLVDRYLLRRTVRKMFEVRYEVSPDDHPQEFRRFFAPAVEGAQASESRAQLTRFLASEAYPQEPALFTEAEKSSKIDSPEDHLQVIARASLLLRVASGSARRLLEVAELSYSEYEWWGRQIGTTRALAAEDDDALGSPALLWGDIDDAISLLDLKAERGDAGDYVAMNDRCAEELSALGGCERIALWGLAA